MGHLRLQKLKNTILEEPTSDDARELAADEEKNAEAYAELIQFLDDKSLSLVMREAADDVPKALKILRDYYAGRGKPRIVSLYIELTSLKMSSSESVTDYVIRAENTIPALRNAGEVLSENGEDILQYRDRRRPNVSRMQKFGSVCYAYRQDKRKLDSRSDKGIFVGYDKNSPAYMVYYPDSRKVKKHRLVRFMSKTIGEQQTQTDKMSDDDDDFGVQHREAKTRLNADMSPSEEQDVSPAEEQDEIPGETGQIKQESMRYPSRERRRPDYLKDYVCDVENDDQAWINIDYCYKMTPATLRHILTGCKTSLSQGRYTWRHNQVLRQLAITLEGRRTTNNALPPPMPRHSKTTPFVRAGQPPAKPSARVEATLLDTARDWRMQVDLEQRLIFPPEIITTNLRPDLVLWSTSQKLLFIVELTVPWEAAVGEAYERKRLKYSRHSSRSRTTRLACPGAPGRGRV
ncbi:hypothetical protein AAFF_G00083800 [Aldrovandia affinis]|uniref:Retroviral polymerase SH3-like domain-containing protein n=1 Tax=Aldrovandia affinis TaxID=143900 RepID=A0AAD7RX46_9TELE|nr:hypothetical protein AAFF_G00083800 [Aldrovandia affinis]